MATTTNQPIGNLLADINALKATLTQTTPAPRAVAAAPAPKSRLTGTAKNGVKVDASDPYRKMVAFTHQAIAVYLKAENKGRKGIHSVLSGFNAALGQQFELGKEDVYAAVDLMTQRGDIQSHWCRMGKMLYLPGTMPERTNQSGNKLLELMGQK